MRILYLQMFPLYGSGSGTYARYLAREVHDLPDAEALVLCPEKRNLNTIPIKYLNMPFPAAFTGHPEWKGCKLYRDLTHDEIISTYLSFLKQTIAAVKEFKPDIIHVHHAFPFSWVARFIKGVYGIPYIVTIHGSELPTVTNDKRYHPLTFDALRGARLVVPNSFYTRDWLIKIFGSDFRRRITVIPGGVDIETFTKASKSDVDAIDKTYGLSGKKVVLFTGKLTPYKGVDYLVKAAKWIKGEVVILGEGQEMEKLKQLVKDQMITNVHLLGHMGSKVSKLVAFYSRADVFVAPSVWDEPLGLVILEAMACETPVVVTKKGGIPLAVKEWRNGVFIRARRVMDIVEKVNYLLDNDEKRKRMGKTAREIVEQRFSWKMIAQNFYTQYTRSV